MPYNPTVQDRSGELLANGISQAGQSVVDGFRQYQQNQAMTANMLGKVKLAADKGLITMDDLNRFSSGNMNAKREVFSMADLAMTQSQLDATQQLEQDKLQLRKDELDRIHPTDWNNTPTPVKDDKGNVLYYLQPTSPQQNQVVPISKMEKDEPLVTQKVGNQLFVQRRGQWHSVSSPSADALLQLLGGNINGGGNTNQKSQLSPDQQKAADWAKSNPNDPRSKEILTRLGL